MYETDLHLKMYEIRGDFSPELDIKEIFDFCSTEVVEKRIVNYDETDGIPSFYQPGEYIPEYSFIPNITQQKSSKTTKAKMNKRVKHLTTMLDKLMKLKRTIKTDSFQKYADEKNLEMNEEKNELKRLISIQTANIDKIKNDARMIPITNFIEFRGGFAKCIWHEEKTASLKLYPDNHVHCFGCQKNGDTIDVVQALNHCTFNEAIKIILA